MHPKPPQTVARRPGLPLAHHGPGHSYRPDDRPPSIFGAHQPGIASPHLDHAAFAALDLRVERVAELRELPPFAGDALERSLSHGDVAVQACARERDVPVQRRLAESDALSAFTRHVGSAVFALPPGARPGGFLAEPLLAAR